MTCPRCGRAQPPDAAGPFCSHCGQFLVPMKWVAAPPETDAAAVSNRPPSRGRYTGPPRYLSPPAWGFPALPWQRAEAETEASSAEFLVAQAGLLIPLLRGLAVLAVIAAGGEAWRYVLLLRSRNAALGAGEVSASDALVGAAGWITTIMTVGVGVLVLLWVLRAMKAAAERTGTRPARSSRAVVVGWLLPPMSLTVPGSVLSEIEHAALDRDPELRPDPSRLLVVWWALWASNVVVGLIAVLWLLRTGTQARADGVLQHVLLDLLAAGCAVVTALVVQHLTALLGPTRRVPLPRVVRVGPDDSSTEAAATVSPR